MATRTAGRRKRARKPAGPRSRDRHWLYQESVQSPEVHFPFFERVYRMRNKDRRPLSLKEDFCGTALLAAQWVNGHRERTAIGVDLHAPTLKWGRVHNINTLPPHAQSRVVLRRANVLRTVKPRVDIVVALNFSYFIFRTRPALLEYFQAARRSLTPGGVFIIDMFGGWDAQRPSTERTRHPGFTYEWELARFDPVASFGQYYINFEFHNGGGIRHAFSYAWRLWTIPEIRELLEEAGFTDIDLYWEGFDMRTGFGNSVFRRVDKAKNSQGWIAFFVASP
jgi:SAM-dependent methyltransferase